MPLTILTNVNSLSVMRNLQLSQDAIHRSQGNLASGMRINGASDDVAGAVIGVRFQAQVTGLREAMRNANEAISLTQTAEGALQEIGANLQRIRELAVQAANGVYVSSDRGSLQKEVAALQTEITRVIQYVDFNGIKVLSSATTVTFQLGHNDDSGASRVELKLNALHSANATTGIGSALGAQLSIAGADKAMDS